jgi:murein DD-endopeptidase MepM/ murein hydrolase activator NlpD
MTSGTKARPFLTLALSTLIIVGATVPALPAEAASEPPFVIDFPQDPQPTVFSSTFGASRSSGRRHQGNDLMAPKLTHVYAAAAGIVTVIDTHGSAGRYVEIQHEAGWSTRYLHLNNDDPGTDNGRADWSLTLVPGVEVGSHVDAGQHIGFVGDSGNAEWTGSHTHFELAHDGGEVDPYPILKDAYARAIAMRAAAIRGSMRFGEVKLN